MNILSVLIIFPENSTRVLTFVCFNIYSSIIKLYSIRNGIIKNRENNKNLEFNKKMGMLSKRTMKREKV